MRAAWALPWCSPLRPFCDLHMKLISSSRLSATVYCSVSLSLSASVLRDSSRLITIRGSPLPV